MTVADVEQAIDRAAVRYDRDGDQHYDITSALIKSIRGSDVDAALHYLARMVEAGEDPRFIARRLVILASEDVGMADPTSLPLAVAAMQAVTLVGYPEATDQPGPGRHPPQPRAEVKRCDPAIGRPRRDVRAGLGGPVPAGCGTPTTPELRRSATGTGYRYPHDFPHGVVEQQYAPDAVLPAATTSPATMEPSVTLGRTRRTAAHARPR